MAPNEGIEMNDEDKPCTCLVSTMERLRHHHVATINDTIMMCCAIDHPAQQIDRAQVERMLGAVAAGVAHEICADFEHERAFLSHAFKAALLALKEHHESERMQSMPVAGTA